MLSVDINRDIEKYQESVIGGLDGKKSLALVVCVGIGAGFGYFFYFKLHINMNLIALMVFPIVLPIILITFGNKNGLTFMDRMHYKRHHKNGYLQNKSFFLADKEREIEEVEKASEEKSKKKDIFSRMAENIIADKEG